MVAEEGGGRGGYGRGKRGYSFVSGWEERGWGYPCDCYKYRSLRIIGGPRFIDNQLRAHTQFVFPFEALAGGYYTYFTQAKHPILILSLNLAR